MKNKLLLKVLTATFAATIVLQSGFASTLIHANEVEVTDSASDDMIEYENNTGESGSDESATNPIDVTEATLRILSSHSVDTINQMLSEAFFGGYNHETWEYYCTGKSSTGALTNDAWGSISGFTSSTGKFVKIEYTHSALSNSADGDYKVRVSGTTKEYTLHKVSKYDTEIAWNQDIEVGLIFDGNSIDTAATKEALYNSLFSSCKPALTMNDVSLLYVKKALGIEYTSAVNEFSEGTYTVRVSWNGNDEYKGFSKDLSVRIADNRLDCGIAWSSSVEVGLVYSSDQAVDFEATKTALFDAVFKDCVPTLSMDDISMKKVTSILGIETVDNLDKISEGTITVRFSWNGDQTYKGFSKDIIVTFSDLRIASSIVCNEGVSFTYTPYPEEMETTLYNAIINWEASELPEQSTLSLDDFTIEYYAKIDSSELTTLEGMFKNIDLSSYTSKWVPIEGETTTYPVIGTITYPKMGAGEQKVRLTYKGNAEYRPSASVEATVSVAKATTKVKVKLTSIYAGAPMPSDLVTVDSPDKFDIYTVYAGLTSDIDPVIYVSLPEKYTNSYLLQAMDSAFTLVYGKSLSQIMNEGTTVKEVREFVNNAEIIARLERLGIDTGAYGQLVTIISKLPSIADNVRVCFGAPTHAGLYTVVAVASNPNYETAYGVGELLIRKNTKDVEFTWNATIPNNKISAADASTFDFGATLTCNGKLVSQDNVKVLYSGVTSKLRVYSSTTTAPTEPGSYVVTYVTIGGDYQAAPITRAYKITK